MRSYEAMIAYHPETGEAGVKDLLERAKQVIATNGGEVTQVVEWGMRDLAYRIAKQRRAAFFVVEFKGDGRAVAELERSLRISDRVLRYITVQVDPNRPPLEAPRGRRDGPQAASEGAPVEGEGREALGDADAKEGAAGEPQEVS